MFLSCGAEAVGTKPRMVFMADFLEKSSLLPPFSARLARTAQHGCAVGARLMYYKCADGNAEQGWQESTEQFLLVQALLGLSAWCECSEEIKPHLRPSLPWGEGSGAQQLGSAHTQQGCAGKPEPWCPAWDLEQLCWAVGRADS